MNERIKIMKLAAFDLEIAKELPEGETDWKQHRPLGISCAATMTEAVTLTYDSRFSNGRIPQRTCRLIVRHMIDLVNDGHTIVTVNGVGFDFDVLAEESGMKEECAFLALNHCDLMIMSVCRLGWRTGLDAFAKGAGIESKLKSVELSDGRILEGMNGAKAPEMWAAGEYDAVMAYLEQDVRATLGTGRTALERGALSWRSGSGKPYSIILPPSGLPTVSECLDWFPPDVSWMDTPPDAMEICRWALEALGI